MGGGGGGVPGHETLLVLIKLPGAIPSTFSLCPHLQDEEEEKLRADRLKAYADKKSKSKCIVGACAKFL